MANTHLSFYNDDGSYMTAKAKDTNLASIMQKLIQASERVWCVSYHQLGESIKGREEAEQVRQQFFSISIWLSDVIMVCDIDRGRYTALDLLKHLATLQWQLLKPGEILSVSGEVERP